MTTKADFDLGCSDGQLGAEVAEVQPTLASVSMLAPGPQPHILLLPTYALRPSTYLSWNFFCGLLE